MIAFLYYILHVLFIHYLKLKSLRPNTNKQEYFTYRNTLIVVNTMISGKHDYQASTKQYPARVCSITFLQASKILFFFVNYVNDIKIIKRISTLSIAQRPFYEYIF